MLDGVEDPHNLGAIVRTAHAAGAAAVVIPERRAAGLTEIVARAAAGALAYLPVVRVTNVNRALEDVEGAAATGSTAWTSAASISTTRWNLPRPPRSCSAAKGSGLHEHVAKHCDFLVRIPMAPGGVASLNVSVAAGVMLFEWRRRVVV